MAAAITFIAGGLSAATPLVNGSGLGFYGSTFGSSVQVSSYQDTSFITSADGSTNIAQVYNNKFKDSASGYIAGSTVGTGLLYFPNYQTPLNVRFTYDTGIRSENVYVYVYDRVAIANPQSGVTCKVAEIIHPSTSQTVQGSGSTTWTTMAGTGVPLHMANSPGASGHYAGNGSTSTRNDSEHDWYLAISASPDSIGAKTQFGLWVQLEYF